MSAAIRTSATKAVPGVQGDEQSDRRVGLVAPATAWLVYVVTRTEAWPMIHCPSCLQESPDGSRFCAACGRELAGVLGATRLYVSGTVSPAGDASRGGEVPAEPDHRFLPGMVLLGRYRVVSAVGHGGMGEVYRADDLRLHEPVALKFLPRSLLDDPDLLQRLHGEVRIARQVTHPLVCRVHDIAEVDGQAFITMEFIDGEDLGFLLRRIGRLSEDKGVQVACQLCEGLAAVHEQGIVHRDLKPRNIMIDGRGRARLTDFGLAVATQTVPPADFGSGTPAYMAPEQLAGGVATTRSDLFSLGLVLSEVFTGRRAFPANNREELARLYAGNTPPPISDLLPGLDPRIVRVIRRCLEKDPAKRPASALAVVSELPRPDPLAAAIADGRLPSPEIVANAAADGTVSPPLAAGLLAAALLGLVLVAFLAPRGSIYGMVPLDLSARQLTARAHHVVDRFCDATVPADSRSGFSYDYEYLNYAVGADPTVTRWLALTGGEPPALAFWFRQSPRLLSAAGMGLRTYPGRVTPTDPPPTVPDMVHVFLGTRGQLIEFARVPDPRTPATAGTAAVDWRPLFEEATLDWASAKPATPEWAPPFFAEQRYAWLLPNPTSDAADLRVEAAACGGDVVYFKVFHGPWDRPLGLLRPQQPESRQFQYIYAGLLCVLLAGSAWLARRNLRLGLGDRTGALRLAGFQFACYLLCGTLVADHVASFGDEAVWLMKVLGFAGVWSLLCGLLYVAVEPYVRRRWPWRMVSWNRLLAGRMSDPMVGRDCLIGVLLGIFLAMMHQLGIILPPYFGRPSPAPLLAWPGAFTNVPFHLLMELPIAVRDALQMFFLLFLFVLFARNEWLAVLVVFGVVLAYNLSQELELDWFWTAHLGTIVAAFLFVALRFGFLASTVGLFVCYFLYQIPLTLDFSRWYAWLTPVYLALPASMAVFGFLTARGGQSEFAG